MLWAEQARLGLLGEHEAVVGVPTPDGLAVAARRETLERVLADRLEHSQARLVAAALVRSSSRLFRRSDSTPSRMSSVGLLGDELGGAEREPADEDAEAREELLLCGLEELVAPLDRPAERPLPLGHA